MSELLFKTIEFPVKDVDMGARTLVQAFTRYNVKDSDGDIGRKGMFKKTWGENFSRIKHLLNHDIEKPLGKTEKLWEDSDFAYGQSKIGTHELGNDFLKMADSGLITEASYGYKTVKDNSTKEGNELLEVKQWEWSSLTAWGANPYTPIISLTKNLTKIEQSEKISSRIKALELFCSNTTATDETIQYLLQEMKCLQQAFIDLTTQPAHVAVEPEAKNGLLVNRLKSINQLLNATQWQTKLKPITALISS